MVQLVSCLERLVLSRPIYHGERTSLLKPKKLNGFIVVLQEILDNSWGLYRQVFLKFKKVIVSCALSRLFRKAFVEDGFQDGRLLGMIGF